MFLCIPLALTASIIGPICIKKFGEYLTPLSFFDCQFTVGGFYNSLTKKTREEGLKYIFKNLSLYWCLIGGGMVIKGFGEAYTSGCCIEFSVRIISSLLDVLFNKMMLLSETTKNVNTQGSLANILFTDTIKIQTFARTFYFVIMIPCELVIAIAFLGGYVDGYALIGVLIILIIFPITGVCMIVLKKAIKQISTLRDTRCQKITEVLNAIKVVKLFNTEMFQEKKILNIHDKELAHIRTAGTAFSVMVTGGSTSYIPMIMLTFGVMILKKRLDMT